MDFTIVSETELTFELATAEALSFDLSGASNIEFTLDTPSQIGIDNYDGPYEVTPSQSVQILNTCGLRATQNFTINAIPSNYGLITWNGSSLKVS